MNRGHIGRARFYGMKRIGAGSWGVHAFVLLDSHWTRRAEVHMSMPNLTDEDYRLNPLTLHWDLPRQRTLAPSFKFHF